MGAIDLNKVAISMGKVLILLSEVESLIKSENDIYEHKEDFCTIAYICRIGILDRIEGNSYMLNPTIPIRIPTGIFSSRKETMESALNVTVGKLKEIVSGDIVTEKYVEDILNKQDLFYEYERIIPNDIKRKL